MDGDAEHVDVRQASCHPDGRWPISTHLQYHNSVDTRISSEEKISFVFLSKIDTEVSSDKFCCGRHTNLHLSISSCVSAFAIVVMGTFAKNVIILEIIAADSTEPECTADDSANSRSSIGNKLWHNPIIPLENNTNSTKTVTFTMGAGRDAVLNSSQSPRDEF
ncbi:hypothetical protein HZH68_000982 [Vespula germanica]|uniref:Uncharacterized protein n=1 Tax=Vespula germanica TaxID=30212 RepID=A0A834NV77_VESGE|nr:hypothetical protein HZH68_000982 [Vespula germanica]